MNSTQAKISGGGVAGLICWLWNGCVVQPLGWPDTVLMSAETGVVLSLVMVALFDKLFNTALPVGSVVAAPEPAAEPVAPEGAPLADGGGREAPVPFA